METVRIVMADASPKPDTEEFALYGGATINVYTTELSEQAALLIAAHEIAETGWKLDSIDETFLLTRDDLIDATPDGVAYFEQALIDDIVLVIHTYPAIPQEGDAIH